MFLLLSVFVLASVAIPEVAPDPCEDLENCVNDMAYGANGTWGWVWWDGLPAHNYWIDYINGTCNDWQDRYECNTEPFREACNNATIRKYAQFEWRLKETLCSPRGRQFLERIYTEAPQCIANRTLAEETRATWNECAEGHNYLTSSTSKKCTDLTAARDCGRKWAGERCGDLFRWLVDMELDKLFEVYLPACIPRPSQFQFPSS